MPPKNWEMSPGQLIVVGPDGETYPLGEGMFPELEIIDSSDYSFELPHQFEGTIAMSRSKFLYYLCGVSNNWLKMHGYPMIRKVRR